MVISQGEVWWAELRPPAGSEPGFRRRVVVVQGDALNRSRIATPAKLDLILTGIDVVLGQRFGLELTIPQYSPPRSSLEQ